MVQQSYSSSTCLQSSQIWSQRNRQASRQTDRQ